MKLGELQDRGNTVLGKTIALVKVMEIMVVVEAKLKLLDLKGTESSDSERKQNAFKCQRRGA